VITAVTLWTAAGGGLVPLSAQQVYQRPLRPEGFSARAVVLPARRIGDSVIRSANALAVEIRVRVRDYLPGGMAPLLVIDGQPVETATGAIEVQDAVTTIAFILERPDAVRDGATLAVQVGDRAETRGRVPGVLRRAAIRPLEGDEAQRLGVPALADWLRGGTQRPD
jgi:hypothetical protein